MGYFYGVIAKEGQIEDANGELKHLYISISNYPFDKKKSYISRQITLDNRLVYNTEEAIFESQIINENNLVFSFVGRIDNRKELCVLLGIENSKQLADGDLVYKLYKKYQQKCITKLVGDWCFLVFNELNNEFFVCKSPIGFATFFYYQTQDKFYFSSSFKSFLSLPSFNKKLNLKYVEQIMFNQKDNTNLFLFKDIFYLKNAHHLTLSKGKVIQTRFWFPEDIQIQKGKTPKQYANELYAIFYESVKNSLRSYKPAISSLSGGLDSGSISVVAAELLKEKGEMLETISHVPDKEATLVDDVPRHLDESENLLLTAKYSGNIKTNLIDSKEYGVIESCIKRVEHVGLSAGIPSYWSLAFDDFVNKVNSGVLLDGKMGNFTISFAGFYDFLPLKHPAVFKSLRTIYHRFRHNNIFLFINRWRYAKENKDFITNKYLAPYGDKLWLKDSAEDYVYNFNSKNELLIRYLHLDKFGENSREAMCNYARGFEKRDPTRDLRVIEYALSIPNGAFINSKGEYKNIIKLMMKDKLPDKVLFDTKRGLQNSDFIYKLKKDVPLLKEYLAKFKHSKIVNKYFNLAVLNKSVEELINTNNYSFHYWAIFVRSFMMAYTLYINED